MNAIRSAPALVAAALIASLPSAASAISVGPVASALLQTN